MDCEGSSGVGDTLGLGGGSSGVGRRKLLVWKGEALRLSSGVGKRKLLGWEGKTLGLSSEVGNRKFFVIASVGGGGLLEFTDRPTYTPTL